MRAPVHFGEALPSTCLDITVPGPENMLPWDGHPDWDGGALSEAHGAHGSSLEFALDE
jgi:hypothetical protein